MVPECLGQLPSGRVLAAVLVELRHPVAGEQGDRGARVEAAQPDLPGSWQVAAELLTSCHQGPAGLRRGKQGLEGRAVDAVGHVVDDPQVGRRVGRGNRPEPGGEVAHPPPHQPPGHIRHTAGRPLGTGRPHHVDPAGVVGGEHLRVVLGQHGLALTAGTGESDHGGPARREIRVERVVDAPELKFPAVQGAAGIDRTGLVGRLRRVGSLAQPTAVLAPQLRDPQGDLRRGVLQGLVLVGQPPHRQPAGSHGGEVDATDDGEHASPAAVQGPGAQQREVEFLPAARAGRERRRVQGHEDQALAQSLVDAVVDDVEVPHRRVVLEHGEPGSLQRLAQRIGLRLVLPGVAEEDLGHHTTSGVLCASGPGHRPSTSARSRPAAQDHHSRRRPPLPHRASAFGLSMRAALRWASGPRGRWRMVDRSLRDGPSTRWIMRLRAPAGRLPR
jgi:hypothetical protein